MRALTVTPGITNSLALEDVSDPSPSQGSVVINAHAIGICGTDREIFAGKYSVPAPAEPHEQ